VSLRWRKYTPHFVPTLLCVILFGGCKGFETTKDIGFYAVSAKRTRVYRFGPGQMSAGDTTLTEGSRLVMLRREYGYSRVMTPDGQKGFVLTADIEPARTEPGDSRGPNLAPQPPRGSGAPGVSSANRSVLQSGALFENTEVLPLPQDPDAVPPPIDQEPKLKGKKNPGFRVTVPNQAAPEASPGSKGG
jgi:hypothetical protein